MHKFERWLIGFTCVVLSEYNSGIFVTSQEDDDYCPIYGVPDLGDNAKGAECSNMDLTEVPQDIRASISSIRLNQNPRLNLRNDSFTKYSKLKFLEMNYLFLIPGQKEPEVSTSTFLPLVSLEIMFMVHSYYTKNFLWPASIKTLVIDQTNFTDLDVTAIRNLSALSVSGTGLRDAPGIHRLAPLKSFRAQSNPLDILSAESLSQYCLLEDLLADVKLISPTPLNFCRCTRLEKWISMQNVTLEGTFDCAKPTDPITCSSDFAEAIDRRDTCLMNHGKLEPSMIYWIKWIGGILLVGSVLLLLISLAYRYFRKKSETSESEIPEENVAEEVIGDDEEE